MIHLSPFTETHIKLTSDDPGVEHEIYEFFTFFVPGYKYSPKFKSGIWDGKIHLYQLNTRKIYKGLVSEIVKFAKDRDHEITIHPDLNPALPFKEEDAKALVDSLNLHVNGEPLKIREYQYDAVHQALKERRKLLLSPTASGKSMIIMSYIRHHLKADRNILIITPTTMLVNQLKSDFVDYSSHNGWSVEDNVQLLYSGQDRNFTKPVIISTWQSLLAMMKDDPKNFNAIIKRSDCAVWDEAHTYDATIVLSVMEKFVDTPFRLGLTATIENTKINALTLVGLMGPIYQVTTTAELMKDGHVSKLDIKCINLVYPEHIAKAYKGMDYKEEVNFLVGYADRNKFLARLVAKIPGNVLVLFNFVGRHGEVLERLIKDQTSRPVYFISGSVKAEERERIRKALNEEKEAICVATSSLVSTGVNIPSISNIVFAIPVASQIRVLQSIGRGLRLRDGKDKCVLWDISDDISYKKYTNHTMKHFQKRLDIYGKESFDWSITRLNLG